MKAKNSFNHRKITSLLKIVDNAKINFIAKKPVENPDFFSQLPHFTFKNLNL